MAGLMNPEDVDGVEEGEDDEFSPGGAVNFPSFLQNIFPGMGSQKDETPDSGAKSGSKEKEGRPRKKNKRRHISTYCTDLTARLGPANWTL